MLPAHFGKKTGVAKMQAQGTRLTWEEEVSNPSFAAWAEGFQTDFILTEDSCYMQLAGQKAMK